MCVMSGERDIKSCRLHLWDVYNILESDTSNVKCEEHQKNGKQCGKRCGYKHKKGEALVYTCKKHFPKDKVIKPSNVLKEKKVQDYLLQDIARIVLRQIVHVYDSNREVMDSVKKIIIELQPKINNKMKLISHLIYGKFVELYMDKDVTVRFVRASQKLKAYKGPVVECNLKGAYAKRKFLAIQYTRWFLATQFQSSAHWLSHYETHPKKDDLADTFLMCLNGRYL